MTMLRLSTLVFLLIPAVTFAAEPTTALSVRLSSVFLSDQASLETVCQKSPVQEAALARLLRTDVAATKTEALRVIVEEIRDGLVADQRFLISEALNSSVKLAGIGKMLVVIEPTDTPNAHPDQVSNSVKLTVGLLRDDAVAVLGSALPLCGVFYPELYNRARNRDFDSRDLLMLDALAAFIIRFQLLHEIGHLLLDHQATNQRCEELDADRFAFDYLYAALDPIMRNARSFSSVTIELTWPRGSRDWLVNLQTHPSQQEREDRIFFTRMMHLREARAWMDRDKLSVLGGYTHGTVRDKDVHWANWELEELLSKGATRCHAEGQH